ncbi:MAG TPA: DNA translocase FtsK 4TM domain-containing protein, partial [Pirellulales bacterium]|nr:DNA translocase FtsK 4TM domain-containing protein [Pirellulales bacterium]
MPEPRNLKADLAALALLALTIFLAIALATYDPADPPSSLVYPTGREIHNACGRIGAQVAALLFEGFGLGAYYLVVSLAVLDAALLRRQRIDERWLRGAGWLMSLVGITTLAALVAPQLSPGPVIGSGGYLGAAGRGLLEMHFATAGAYILVLSLLAGGLLLSTDYLLVRLSAWLVAGPAKGVGMALGGVGQIYDKRRTRPRTDLGGPNDLTATGSQPLQVRIAGKVIDEAKPAADDEQKPATAKKIDRKAAAATPDAEPENSAEDAAESELRVRPPLKKKDAREEVMEELDAAVSQPQETADYELPSIDLLMEGEPFAFEEQEKEVRRKA